MPHKDLSAVEADVRTWFDQYVSTFIGLAAAGRTDPAPLLDYFSVPITMTTDAAHMVLATTDALAAGLANELQTLRDADYGGSTALDLQVRALNERSAVVEVTWSRNDSGGREFQRVRVLYLAARTVAGWRTTASAILSP
ncbi:hypothetical protein PV721_25315 [Streptomyces sp. MB09-01]|uniref:DUF6841 family protein n=1 Tax=Streptomyces sp. MB09-01 TaxID=3028666 RepID=UPI0029A25928|nr:hypothetical protein [Streptomyces sp. MB09-01]MDX3537629.1 hypothetical protein [Streptomyces sp. MB09-01]